MTRKSEMKRLIVTVAALLAIVGLTQTAAQAYYPAVGTSLRQVACTAGRTDVISVTYSNRSSKPQTLHVAVLGPRGVVERQVINLAPLAVNYPRTFRYYVPVHQTFILNIIEMSQPVNQKVAQYTVANRC